MKTSTKEIAGDMHLKSFTGVLAAHKHKVTEYHSVFSKEENTIINRQKQPIVFFNGQSPSITIQQDKFAGFANKQNIPWL